MTAFPVLPANAIPWEKRMDVVATYMLIGNLRVVSEKHDINYQTLLEWRKQDWWPEMVAQLRRQKKVKQAESITTLVENSLETIQDRLLNGDVIFNQKTGKVERKPVSAKDALAIANNLIQRQLQLEEIAEKSQVNVDTMQETLALLAKEFQKWNRQENRRNSETIEFKEKSDEKGQG